jgi:hypothetical protein
MGHRRNFERAGPSDGAMARPNLTALLAAGALLFGHAAAGATPFSVEAPHASGPVLGTGGRYAAFMGAARTLHVLDSVRAATYDIALPASCPDPTQLLAVGGGQALFGCDDARQIGHTGTPLLLDLGTREWHEPVGATELLETQGRDGGADFEAVGAQWLMGHAVGDHSYTTILLDWRTGVGLASEGTPWDFPTLDGAEPYARLCAPFSRRQKPDTTDGIQYFGFPYEPPYRIVGTRLQACGSTHPGLALDAPDAVRSAQLSDGYATWTTPGSPPQVRAYLPICGVRFTWPVKGLQVVMHTSRDLVATSSTSASGSAQFAILRHPRPECPELAADNAVMVVRDHVYRIAQLVGASWPTSADGSPRLLRRNPFASAPLPRRTRQGAIVRTGFPTLRIRWRMRGEPWRPAAGYGRRWQTGALPPGVLELAIRGRDGALGSYRLAVD